jgi:hypothetical protein
LYSLPEKAQNKMLFSFFDVTWPHVHNMTTDRFGTSQGQLMVFKLLVDRQGLTLAGLVQRALVDRVRNTEIY